MRRREALALLGAGLPALAAGGREPETVLAALRGEWRGTLSYRDLASPGRIATRPARLQVSLPAPGVLALHFIHDDAAGRPIESHERLRFQWTGDTLVWTFDAAPRHTRVSFEFDAEVLSIGLEEIDPAGQRVARNRYSFSRPA